MKPILVILAAACVATGCAEQSLLENEQEVLAVSQISSDSNLKTLGNHAAALTGAYRRAARQAQKGQDAAAVVTYLAAVGFVSGAVGSASNTALANRAAVGVGSTTLASRTVSMTAIKGIYTSAKRMNCVATTARMGASLLEKSESWTKNIARAATFGAIEEIRIISREALVRDVADFVTVRDGLIAGLTLTDEQLGVLGSGIRGAEDGGANLVELNQYLRLLDNCLADEADLTAVAPIENQES